MTHRLWVALLFSLAGCADVAVAQSVQQSGSVTRGHIASWAAPGVVQDGGTATSGAINSLGLYGSGGTPLCITDSPTPGPFSGSYAQLCFGVSSSASYLNINSFGSIPALPFQININGTTVFTVNPTSVASGGVRVIQSGASDTASPTDLTVAWNSSTATAKAETIPACTSALAAHTYHFKDEAATSGTYAIVITPSGGTVERGAVLYLNSNSAGITLQCDGISNWMAL